MASMSILVVDDDRDICSSLSDILSDLGYAVDTANDGAAALELSERNSYRLALLDYMLPGMDGLELCRRLRASRPAVEVALVTACSLAAMTDAAGAGVRLVLAKPIVFGLLLPLVEEVVGNDEGAPGIDPAEPANENDLESTLRAAERTRSRWPEPKA